MKKKIKKYEKGRRFEYKVKKFYEHLGYYVIRSASSKGLFDLIAFNQDFNPTLGLLKPKEYPL